MKANSNLTIKIAKVLVASAAHQEYAEAICEMIETAAKIRGTGIAKRSSSYIKHKMQEQKAVIALADDGELAGFCYIETWDHAKYVAHSGLIVNPAFRGQGLAKKIKKQAFELSQKLYPEAKIFGLTTSLPVMKINSELGYKPVTFSELTQDEEFWKGCQSCVNYDVLTRTNRKHCLCTGMIHEKPKVEVKEKNKGKDKPNKKSRRWRYPLRVYARWIRYKQNILLKFGKRVLNPN